MSPAATSATAICWNRRCAFSNATMPGLASKMWTAPMSLLLGERSRAARIQRTLFHPGAGLHRGLRTGSRTHSAPLDCAGRTIDLVWRAGCPAADLRRAPGGWDCVPAPADALKDAAQTTRRPGRPSTRPGGRAQLAWRLLEVAELRSAGRTRASASYVVLTRLTIIAIVLWAARAAPSCQPII